MREKRSRCGRTFVADNRRRKEIHAARHFVWFRVEQGCVVEFDDPTAYQLDLWARWRRAKMVRQGHAARLVNPHAHHWKAKRGKR